MKQLALFLKCISPVFFIAGALHLIFGLQADVMLGANISSEVIADAALDSQNRFYGVAFVIYGVLFYLCSTDIKKYKTVLKCLLWVFFLAGLSRFISIFLYGSLPPLVMGLFLAEILLPPIVLIWLSKIENN